MATFSNLSNIARSEGDPKVLRTGPSSLGATDRMARALGWFSIALGVTELVAARRFTRFLGMEGNETLIRIFGAREIAQGVVSLSVDKQVGLWSRVAGDGMDVASVLPALRRSNPKRENAGLALAVLAGIGVIDYVVATAVSARHARYSGARRSYADRSGFPKGLEAARNVSRNASASAAARSEPSTRAGVASPSLAQRPSTPVQPPSMH